MFIILEEPVGPRRRDDKPRTKIIRLLKKLPDRLLKLLVSVGDYKHKDSARLAQSYNTAFQGFLNLLQYWNLDLVFNSLVSSSVSKEVVSIRFASICFPKQKVSTVADELSVTSEVHEFLSMFHEIRNGTSVKQFKAQTEVNPLINDLTKLAFHMVKDEFEESSNSVRLLKELLDN
jgi:hypothetical protein